jgi:Cys-tRNA(Pro) deacylase
MEISWLEMKDGMPARGESAPHAMPYSPRQRFVRARAPALRRMLAPTMARTKPHVSETPATALLRQHGVAFTEHVYDYVEHGGTAESSRQLGVPEHEVVKTLVMQDDKAQPLIVLMHGDKQVSTKNLARAIGAKSVEPCKPDVAQRHSGYLVGGTSPFGTRKAMPVFVEASILALPRICINGGRRGFLVGIAPAVLTQLLQARPVQCAID